MTTTRFAIARIILSLTVLLTVLAGPALRADVGPGHAVRCFCGGPVNCPRHRPQPITPRGGNTAPARTSHPAVLAYKEGKKAFDKGDWNAAIRHYWRAITEGKRTALPGGLTGKALASAMAAAYNSWGNDLLRKGSAYDAIKKYEAAREYDPKNVVVRENLVNAHRRIRVDRGIDLMTTSSAEAVRRAIEELPATASRTNANQRKRLAAGLKSPNNW